MVLLYLGGLSPLQQVGQRVGFAALRPATWHSQHGPGALVHAPVTHGLHVNQEGAVLASCHACTPTTARSTPASPSATHPEPVGLTFDQLGAGEAQHARVAGQVQATGQPHWTTQNVLLMVLQKRTQHRPCSKERRVSRGSTLVQTRADPAFLPNRSSQERTRLSPDVSSMSMNWMSSAKSCSSG